MPSRSYREPSVDETLKHPAYPGAVWALEPHQHGKLPVAKGRGGPINIAWEIHGDGPIKIVLIMGLAGVIPSWQRQTLYFGHDRGERYSVLVLDNRGMGASDKPLMRYSTSEMARDVIEVLDHVGWTAARQVNLVGISLGGMIAQELACAVPQRVQSLSLLCTSALLRGERPPAHELAKRLAMLASNAEEQSIADTTRRIFVADWLVAPDDEYRRFDSNFQRFQAQELAKRRNGYSFTLRGYLCQMMAAGGHRKSDEQLRAMADAVGRERILVMHGTEDTIIAVKNGRRLVDVIEPADALLVEGMGHAPVMERTQWFNKLLEDRLEAWTQLQRRERHDSVMKEG
ncbi:alpha/beta hydrolase fold domain-containing protein [Hirsutella rhossiliensis]|uniref:Alpha/beta hydrolase fold domain-containing protein n=1 Tax=Hirsutella rhossiliensis TaxID=111463 RepID=A0A9P8SGL1_9HYPO|nr:alpha/beta hydrolase fold domain-containing protein [Hirsutella rhossiliensis]KAH0962178.1 alpha/beta hydrolase fold domain-containing protein [Hirsutella rhossiliensis]